MPARYGLPHMNAENGGADETKLEETMTANEVLQPVQFVTVKGKRLAVLSADDCEVLNL